MPYPTITTEGGLLPSDILEAVAASAVPGQRPEDFGLERSRNLSDRISATWQAARGQWTLFQSFLADLPPDESATSETREQWVLPLLRMLGYGLARNRNAYLVHTRSFAISHRADEADDAPPIHIESIRNRLDARPASGRPRLSPHALMQEYLNSTEQLWGLVTNGERLRLLRDSARFTRPSYVEFDLRAIFEGERFSEFALLFRLLHRSRLPANPDEAAACLLEQYHQQAIEAGGRVREGLRDGVESALKGLGDGLLRHPKNHKLRAKLARGLATNADDETSLTPLGYYRQLLRLVYRLLFLMVAEERGLIAADQRPHPDAADLPELSAALRPPPKTSLRIYYAHYSLGRLRRIAESSTAGRGPFTDLWAGLMTTFRVLEGSDELAPRRLGLAPLDGDLFGDAACADLTHATRLYNADLLAAIRALSLYRDPESGFLRRVNYGALDVEELGSVYESLLDYRPVVQFADATVGTLERSNVPTFQPSHVPTFQPSNGFTFDLVTGTERKTTGSYYTRPELVQELIKSALEPVIDARLRGVADHQKEAAILSIRVIDPACGSGAFLLAAARRLGQALARVRAGEDQPAPSAFRHAVRDVIRRCIFGVDLNPLAVDLCKLALWIEGHAAGLPLSFLDHHIRQGNSLVGASHALVAAGLPDEAYKPVSGDDKPTASSFKKRNKQERELYQRQQLVQRDLFAPDAPRPDLASALRQLDEAADDSVAAVRARAARYAALRRQALTDRAMFDLWTAAFFQPLTPANAPYVPTTNDLLAGDPTSPKALMAAPLAEAVGFFHWELEFPQVFNHRATEATEAGQGQVFNHRATEHTEAGQSADLRGLRASVVHAGFDVVLGNPPWERIKLQEQEHFVDIAAIRSAPNKAAREKLITAWRNGDPVQRARIAQFDAAKQRAEAESRFVRAAGRFPLTAVGDVNTYALFAEQIRNLLAPTGRAGMIVPTGIATDDTTKAFFGDLNATNQLISFYDFENREKIFAEVDSRFKFSLLTLGQSNAPTRFLFFATRIDHLSDPQRAFELTPAEIALINPNTRTAPVFRTKQDADLTKKIYRQAPILVDERSGTNPWGISFLRMFDMSNDSNLFMDAPGEGRLPLYEGRMGFFFDHRFGTFDPKVGDYLANQDHDPNVVCKSQYFVSEVEVDRRIKARNWHKKWFFGIRRVTNSTNERTIIGTFLPYQGVTYGLYLFLSNVPLDKYICLTAMFNSLVLDYLCRNATGQPSLTFGVLNQLPVLPPERFSAADMAYIVPRVLELVYTAWDMRPFAEDIFAELNLVHEAERKRTGSNDAAAEALWREIVRRNEECNSQPSAFSLQPSALSPQPSALSLQPSAFSLPPFIWNSERRAKIRAELDARLARLYGLSRDELRYILDPQTIHGPDFPGETFRVLKEKELKLYGEYRTERLVLGAWDER